MNLLDDDLLLEGADDTEASDGSGEEDKDFLMSLEKKAEEIEREGDNSNTTATYIPHPPPDLPLERGGIRKNPMKVGKTNKISPMQGKNPIKSPPLQGEG